MCICRRKDPGEDAKEYLESGGEKEPGGTHRKAVMRLLFVCALLFAAAAVMQEKSMEKREAENVQSEGTEENLSGLNKEQDSFETAASGQKDPAAEKEIPFENIMTAASSDLTITWSDNDAYGELIALYGSAEFNAWAAEIGCEELVISGGWYASVNARDFAKLWCHMYDRVVAGESLADIINIYTDTLSSSISETLGGQYTVYSKGGWIGEGKGSYYNVQNDEGIVMKGEHPYVLVILSDAYGRLDLLDNLVYVLDQAHTALAGTAG